MRRGRGVADIETAPKVAHPYHACRNASPPCRSSDSRARGEHARCRAGCVLPAVRSYLVGGAIRDLLRGDADITDVDLAVDGDAAPVARRLARRLGGAARVTVHTAFGTSTVRWEDMRVDIARTRSESYARPGSLPAVEPAGIEADLLRRDFTRERDRRFGSGTATACSTRPAAAETSSAA